MTTGPLALTSTALSEHGIAHGFFTRAGGVSGGMYAGLNIGIGSSDDPENVAQNRALAAESLGVSADGLISLYQVHGDRVEMVERPFGPDDRPRADGAVTATPGLALGIATADCAPVLFADPGNGVVGACHAGWKGAFLGIVEATVAAMERAGADRAAIRGVLGPCIHQKSYEVGPEFRDRFLAEDAAHDRFFAPSDRDGHYRFDLPAFVLFRLAQSEIGAIDHVAADTYADPDRFFSYRRATHREERNSFGEIDYGRLLSAIALTS
ncbi:MAG: peptidoglycan editing factor PgeF [Alphaproteobacteria bacterium]